MMSRTLVRRGLWSGPEAQPPPPPPPHLRHLESEPGVAAAEGTPKKPKEESLAWIMNTALMTDEQKKVYEVRSDAKSSQSTRQREQMATPEIYPDLVVYFADEEDDDDDDDDE